jgi:hypothetical protein
MTEEKLSPYALFLRDNSYYHDISGFMNHHYEDEEPTVGNREYAKIVHRLFEHCQKMNITTDIFFKTVVLLCRFLKLSPIYTVKDEEIWAYATASLMTVQLLLDEYLDERIYDTIARNHCVITNLNNCVNRFHAVLKLDVNVPSWMEIVDTRSLSKDEREKVRDILVHVVADYSLISYVPVYDLALASIECIRGGSQGEIAIEIWKSYRYMTKIVESYKKDVASIFPKCIYNEIMSTHYLEDLEKKCEETGYQPVKHFTYSSSEYNEITKPAFKIRKTLDEGDLVDSGAFGEVYGYVCPDDKTSAERVVKIIEETAPIFNELNVLLHVKHPNIVELLEYGYVGSKVYLMMPRAISSLEKNANTSLEEIKNSLRQLLEGLNHLHSFKIIHRDIKPSNILVYKDRLCLCDFGMSQTVNTDRVLSYSVCTFWYRSIDLLLENIRYGTDVDIWSLGCVFFFLTHGEDLFQGDSEYDTIVEIFACLGTPTEGFLTTLRGFKMKYPHYDARPRESFSKMVGKIGDDGVSLLLSMFAYNPKDRITAAAALKSAFLKD